MSSFDWAWEDEDKEVDLSKELNKKTLPMYENTDVVGTNEGNNQVKFSWEDEENNEIDLSTLSKLPGKNPGPISEYGNKKILANLFEEEKTYKSNLTEEQRFGHKDIPLDANEVGVFHDNTPFSIGEQSLGNDLHNNLVNIGSELEEEDVNIEIDKRIEALGQVAIFNNKSEQVMISDDGLSVADLIRAKRQKKKKKKTSEVIKEIKADELKKNYDNPDYARSLKKAQEQVRRKIKAYGPTGKKKAENDSYLGRLRSGAGYTNLLKTLNVNTNELMELLSDDNNLLTKKEKEKILSMGLNNPIYTAPIINKNGNRIRGVKRPTITEGDYHILDFLYRFSHSGLKTISIAVNKRPDLVLKQLDKLIKMACVIEQRVMSRTVYYISPAGYVALTGHKMEDNIGKAKEKALSEKAVVNYVASLVYSNKVNILKLSDYPQSNKYLRGSYINGETLIPERIYRSSLSRLITENFTGQGRGNLKNRVGSAKAAKLWSEWESNGMQGLAPDEILGNEFLYVLYPFGIIGQGNVIPDFVIKRKRDSDGSTNNIAVEVERECKSKEYYTKRLTAYKQDTRMYKEVVYVVNEKRVAKRLLEAKELSGFDRMRIVAFVEENGEVMGRINDPWELI